MLTDVQYSDQRPLDTLVVAVYGSQSGSFSLYEDDGISLDYKTGKYAWTPLAFTKGGRNELAIGPTKGEYAGQPGSRAYVLNFHGVGKPASVTIDGKKVEMGAKSGEGWTWDKEKSVATVTVDAKRIREVVRVVLQ
jgi:hypothetical protein